MPASFMTYDTQDSPESGNHLIYYILFYYTTQ
jgi:hypothetical protein